MGRTKWDWAGFDHLSWVFDHSSCGSCHLKEGEQSGRRNFWQWKVWTHCEIQRHNGDLSVKGETGSVKGETKSANFWQGKCKLIANCANFLQVKVGSSPILAPQWWRHFRLSLSLSLYLSLSLSPKVPHAQYRKRFRASYNNSSVKSYPEIGVKCQRWPAVFPGPLHEGRGLGSKWWGPGFEASTCLELVS